MACCGRRPRTTHKKIASEEQSTKSSIAPFNDLVSVSYTGNEKDIFYGYVTGNRYVISPNDVIEIDRADLERLLESGAFILV